MRTTVGGQGCQHLVHTGQFRRREDPVAEGPEGESITLVVLATVIIGAVVLTWLRVGTPEERLVGSIAAFTLYYGVATLVARRNDQC